MGLGIVQGQFGYQYSITYKTFLMRLKKNASLAQLKLAIRHHNKVFQNMIRYV